MKSPIRVASVQFQHLPGDKLGNLAIMRRFIAQAAAQQVQLICFPECCISGYWHLRSLSKEELTDLAEPIPNGAASLQLSQWAQEFGMTIGGGLVERDADEQLYNAYYVALPDGSWFRHRKLHCFVSPHMLSGSDFTTFDLPGGWRASVLICYDNNIVENVRVCALAGAELMLAPHQTGGCNSGSPFAMKVIDRRIWDARETNPDAIHAELVGDKGRAWLLRWLPSRAHDNGLFYVFSNGVGPDDNEVRTGNAMILDPYGRILTETCRAGDDMIIADLDPTLRDRSTGVRWMRARRPDLYNSLAQPTGNERDTRSVRFEHLDSGIEPKPGN